jgi:hypothetical protein
MMRMKEAKTSREYFYSVRAGTTALNLIGSGIGIEI